MNLKKIVVVKIGSGVLITKRNRLDEFRIAHIAEQVISLRKVGIGLALVISGAVTCGSKHVNITDSISRRMAAGIGQAIVTSTFSRIFSQKGFQIAQLLLTRADINSGELVTLLKRYIFEGFIPVVNENDVVDLNSFGGNDFLGAEISTLLDAEKFIMLSTMKESMYGVGRGRTKKQVIRILHKRNIETKIIDGKVKNILLQANL